MPDIDFSTLMTEEDSVDNVQSNKKFDFTGLMNSEKTKPLNDNPPEDFVDRVINAPERVSKLIEERGNLWEQYALQVNSTSESNPIIHYGNTLLSTVSIPFDIIESALSNPVIEMQKGNFNPIDTIVEFYKGAAGVKQGEFGDIGRQVGLHEPVAAGAGLAASFITPLALISAGKKLKAVTKFGDTKVTRAISKFFKTLEGPNGAMNRVGGKIGAYYDEIGGAPVNQSKLFDEFTKISNATKRAITDIPTDKLKIVDDELIRLAEKGSVKAAHAAKEAIDDLIRNYFTTTSKYQRQLKESSKAIGGIIDDGVFSAQSRIIGKDAAKRYVSEFQKARKDYSVLKNGYTFIKNKLINKNTGKLTKTGSILKEIADPREQNLRTTLSNINKFGTGSNKFANEILSIEKSIRTREMFGSIIEGVGRGVVIGATIGKTMQAADGNNINSKN